MEDLEAFIADIEQTAPVEEEEDSRLKCQECDVPMEEVDGIFTCPICSIQSNMLQLAETEVHYNADGQAQVGQRVRLGERRSRHNIDYGWAWSTDEAIVHILSLQITALEKLGLIPELFRTGITNMWTKFWVNNIAPFIQDEYKDDELVPLRTMKNLKYRDIEVLVKFQDRVMIPKRCLRKANAKSRSYRMWNTKFYKRGQSPPRETDYIESSSDSDSSFELLGPIEHPKQPLAVGESPNTATDAVPDEHLDKEVEGIKEQTRNINRDSVAIITLNRTLAFIEATARCMNLAEPLFASDIIRLCTQRLIPFFGAHKSLPDGIRLNSKDKLMFQKSRPPSPIQLTRTACLLIHRIYHDQLPKYIPVPDLNKILLRFIQDLNLPHDLMNHIGEKVTFSTFQSTKPTKFGPRGKYLSYLPQYDRWAFAILVSQLKRIFSLDDDSVRDQSELAKSKSTDTKVFFDLLKWVRQLSIRLKLILSYDPYMLLHPMTKTDCLEPTPQMYRYLEIISNDTPQASTRTRQISPQHDKDYRSELENFLKRHLPKPRDIRVDPEVSLEKPSDLRHPFLDAFRRTKSNWISRLANDSEITDIVFRDFSCDEVITCPQVKKWSMDTSKSAGNSPMEMCPDWPYCFNLLLFVGGFLCFCEPRELVREVRRVEDYLCPRMKTLRRLNARSKKQAR